MCCWSILHELEPALIVRPHVSTPNRRSAPSTWRWFLFFLSRRRDGDSASLHTPFAAPLTFSEFLACEQISLITSHGDTSALQGKHLTVEERGAAAGCCAALYPSRSSDSDCIICGVIKKAGLDLGGMLS